MEIYIPINGGEKLYRTVEPSEFATCPTGLPRAKVDISLASVLSTLQLSINKVTGGDTVNIRLQLNLTNGKSYMAKDAASSLNGYYFASPYKYSKVIKCIPTGAIDVNYVLNLNDSYGDGWNGAKLPVTVDGVATDYTIDYGASGSFTHTIEGANTKSFWFSGGNWDSEVTYNIVYTALDISNTQIVFSDGPSPSDGEKILSICQ